MTSDRTGLMRDCPQFIGASLPDEVRDEMRCSHSPLPPATTTTGSRHVIRSADDPLSRTASPSVLRPRTRVAGTGCVLPGPEQAERRSKSWSPIIRAASSRLTKPYERCSAFRMIRSHAGGRLSTTPPDAGDGCAMLWAHAHNGPDDWDRPRSMRPGLFRASRLGCDDPRHDAVRAVPAAIHDDRCEEGYVVLRKAGAVPTQYVWQSSHGS
jgi:hypothetical protein